MASTIACFGAAHIDRTARSEGPLLAGTSNPVSWSESHGGVARNIAACLARLGVPVQLFSMVGGDRAGGEIIAALTDLGIDAAGVARAEEPTGSYMAALDGKGDLALGLTDDKLYERLDEDWAARVGGLASGADIWIVDTNLSERTLIKLFAQRPAVTRILADPVSVAKAGRLKSQLAELDTLFPDAGEAALLTGLPVSSIAEAGRAAERLCTMGAGAAVVTMGREGLCWAEGRGQWRHMPALSAVLHDVTGAGDALVAGTVFELWRRKSWNLERSLGAGLAAAAVTLEQDGAAPVALTPDAIQARQDEG